MPCIFVVLLFDYSIGHLVLRLEAGRVKQAARAARALARH